MLVALPENSKGAIPETSLSHKTKPCPAHIRSLPIRKAATLTPGIQVAGVDAKEVTTTGAHGQDGPGVRQVADGEPKHALDIV